MIRRLVRNTGFSRRIAPNFAEILAGNQIDIVLDVGANDGDYGRELRDSGYTGRIHSFEPNPAVFKRLSARIAKDSLWSAVPYGVGNMLNEMVAIQVETSLVDSYVCEIDWLESMLYMRDRGFEVATIVCNSTIPSKARIREFDIVYVRNDA